MVRVKEGQHPGRPLGCEYAKWIDGPACIRFYTNSHCIFCPAAREMLEDMLKVHELSVDSIHKVVCGIEDVGEVTALPTIEICEQTIVGIPEEDMLDQALWMLRVNPCFHER